jgi:glycosyltransferase involved in cell wall biosynthesis
MPAQCEPRPAEAAIPVSILILTLNEAANLPACLASVAWSDDIVVLDSFSTDGTVEIARDAGARVVQRRFDNWAAHQNWAVANIGFKHPWVYYSDADERMPDDLRAELIREAERPDNPHAAYRLRYRNFFMGRWIRHCGIYPVWLLRFFRPERVRWERLVNPIPVVDGAVGRLQSHFHHFSFSKGLDAWFDKHNAYSRQEALEGMKVLGAARPRPGAIFSRDAVVRRQALKNLAFRVPGRSRLRFLHMYVLRLGFLDGRPGYHYCRLIAIYEYMIGLKMLEIRRGGL